MDPYNVKIITFPDLTKQCRIYHRLVEHVPAKVDRIRNSFDGQYATEVNCSFEEYFDYVHEVSLNRTKKKIYDYARCNDWDYFVTFTFSREKVDRYDYDSCVTKLSQWLKNLRKRSPGFSYLIVPEQHKDGAWHFHGLVSGLSDGEIVWSGKYVVKRVREGGRIRFFMTDRKIFKIGSYKLGWMTATEVLDRKRVVKYITKYITKDMMSGLFGRKRYWVSRNLLLPVEETFLMDQVDRFILAGELQEDCRYHISSQRNVFTAQKVDIFDL